MSLEEEYLLMADRLKESCHRLSFTAQEALSLIDLTLLDQEASDEALSTLCEKAKLNRVAAVCVLPQHLSKLSPLGDIKLATVVNFPEGKQSTDEILALIRELIPFSKPNEIDYVFPYSSYLAGEKDRTLQQCHKVYQFCQQHRMAFKVILETGALPSLETIYQLSKEVIAGGCDFLKTSTGKIIQGATPSAAFVMLKAIKDSKFNCGLKVSGGIKKTEQAFNYMALAEQMMGKTLDKSWFRIGASSLLDELMV